MRLNIILFTLALLWPGAATGQQGSSSDPGIHIGLFGYQPDGTIVASAFDTDLSRNALVFSAGPCRMGAGYREPPDYAIDAWRFSGTVMSMSAQVLVIRLDWQRVLDQGNPVTSPGSSVQLTLRAGEKVLLDRGTGAGSPSGCGATVVAFEARFGPHPMRIEPVTPDSGAGVTAAGIGRSPSTRGGRIGNERPRSYLVNLWFVRSAPGRPDEVLHQPVFATNSGMTFAFTPVTIDGPDGAVVVRVAGSFTITKGANGEQLVFMTERRVTPTASVGNRDRLPDAQGGSSSIIPLPGPDDVVAFEMPPIRMSGGRSELPDRLSVRVQVKPR